jgi:UDP-N-acetylmuramoyl-tripeptide--D-alanyl-D-alanine ligase
MEAAVVELMARPAAGRRVAVIGDMLELGDQTERCHRELGRKLANARVDAVWAIGPNAALVAEEARRAGLDANVHHHATMEEALASPAVGPKTGDTWLFKASRGMALEKLYLATRARIGAEPRKPVEAPAQDVATEVPPHA